MERNELEWSMRNTLIIQASNISEKYNVLQSGSMISYKHLLSRTGLYQIVMYNGNWDAAVPYVDTIKNLQKLGLTHSYL